MKGLNIIKNLFMNNGKYFDKYVAYLPTIGKQLKKERACIKVIDKETHQIEVYNNWEELNDVYKLFPVNEKNVTIISEVPLVKYWTYGHKTRFKELIKFFSNQYGVTQKSLMGSFNNTDWVYYLDSHKNICGSSNPMIIDLLKNSSDWVEYKLPPLKKFSKEEIAAIVGMDKDSFIIEG